MTGAELIFVERERQIVEEEWSAAHDEQHACSELLEAACCYAVDPILKGADAPESWPWSEEYWKPKDQIRDLVRAGALIAAEIDRLQANLPVRESLVDELERLREALGFYADKGNYRSTRSVDVVPMLLTSIDRDDGKIARAALEEKRGPDEEA